LRRDVDTPRLAQLQDGKNRRVTPGIHIDRLTDDLRGSPVDRVATAVRLAFADDVEAARAIGLVLTVRGPRHVWVAMLKSHRRRQGLAGRVLDRLCRLCDEAGVVLQMQAVALPGKAADAAGRLDQRALEAFYGRRGFVADTTSRRAHAMTRPVDTLGRPARMTPMASEIDQDVDRIDPAYEVARAA